MIKERERREIWELSSNEEKLPDYAKEILLYWRRNTILTGEDPFSKTIVIDEDGNWHWKEIMN